MKPGIVIVAELTGALASRVHAVQERFDPRMAAELPPHLTLIGSSGMGPISVHTDTERLREALIPAAQSTAPMTLHFEAPMRFMQSNVVVLPIDPNGPVRELHESMAERIRAAKIVTERPRFTFTPHCTLNFYRELKQGELKELLAMRFDDEVALEKIQAYRATGPRGTQRIIELTLGKD